MKNLLVLYVPNCILLSRTLLNRGYANESRNKKLSGDEKTELENRALEAETAATLEEFDHVQFVEVKSLDKREQKLKREIEDLKRYYLGRVLQMANAYIECKYKFIAIFF